MTDDVSHYGQYCPVSRALDVVGERWSLLILRDLILGTTRFNDLARGLPGLSRTLLSKRLRQFERAGIVDHVGDEYVLTPAGRDLHGVVLGLGEWGTRWAFGEPRPEELDPELLAWWMHGRFDAALLDARRTVFHLRLKDHSKRFWFVIESGVPSVCTSDPGYEVDVTIDCDLVSLYLIWLHRLSVPEALRTGRIAFAGPSTITSNMDRILMLSPLSGATPTDLTTPGT